MPSYKYTLKNGKTTLWYANFYYTDWTGTKKHVCKRGFKTQREAKEYEKDFLEQTKNRTDIKFGALVANYMEDQIHRLKPTTMANKEQLIKTHLLPYFQKLRIADIDSIKIRKWQNEMMTKGYSQTYLKTIHNQLSAIMNYACTHYGLQMNPCKAAGSMGKSKAGEMKIWTQEEYERFASGIRSETLRVAFDTLFYTGMREGELLALTPDDIKDGQISINKTFVVVNGQQLMQSTKTEKSTRTIDIPKFLEDELNGLIKKLYGIKGNDRIFSFTKSAITQEMMRTCQRIGMERIRIHDLRHSHASMLASMGYDIKQISERLGHESVKTTWDTYSHLYPDAGKQLAAGLDKLKKGDCSE